MLQLGTFRTPLLCLEPLRTIHTYDVEAAITRLRNNDICSWSQSAELKR